MSASTTLRPHSQPFVGDSSTSASQVPFKPVYSPPSALGFGFGAATRPPQHQIGLSTSFGSAARKSNAGFAFGGQVANLRAAPAAGMGGSRKRRSVSPIEVEMANSETAEGAEEQGRRLKRNLKRLKGVEAETKQLGAKTPGSSEVDVGKSLSHLSKPELLSILQSLISSQPPLSAQIEQLLPPPSLSSFTSHLSAIESAVLSALPHRSGPCALMRDEYIWSRVKPSVEEYVSESRYWVSAFFPPTSSPSNQQHVSTIFTFLAALTASVLRLEVVLPPAPLPAFPTAATMMAGNVALNPLDPLASSLIPHLFNSWHTFVTRLANEVNGQGRMYGHELVRSWLRTLEGLLEQPQVQPQAQMGTGRQSVCRVALEGVKARMVQELGWVAGIKPAVPTTMGGGMEEEEL